MAPAATFELVRNLVAIIRFAADPSLLPSGVSEPIREAFTAAVHPRGSRSGGLSGYRDKLRSPAAAAGFLALVEPALMAPTAEAQLSALEDVCAAALVRRIRLQRMVPLRLPPLVEAAVRTPMPHARIARHAPQIANPVEVFIPELLSADLYTEHLERLLPGTAPLTGRKFASLAVARHLGARGWAAAGRVTGCDAHAAVRVADVVGRRISDVEGFWNAIGVVADNVSRQPRGSIVVRRALSTLTSVNKNQLPPSVLTQFDAWTPTRGRLVAMWLWEHVAGGDWRTSPAILDQTWQATTESRREMYRKFCGQLSSEATRDLADTGSSIASSLPGADL